MGKNTAISWADHTFNPWVGCQKVSAGCKFCYAERDMTRRSRWMNCWGPPESSERLKTSEANWKKPIAWDRKAAKEGIRYKVFCASLGDIFEHNPQVASWRLELWQLIESTPNLDWMLLTKRPENVMGFVPESWKYDCWPEHAWLGITAENQEMADKRTIELLQIPAHTRFISAEPLLALLDIAEYLNGDYAFHHGASSPLPSIHWVIIGGESGPKARAMHPGWARLLRDQCQENNIHFHFKQWGEWLPIDCIDGYLLEPGQTWQDIGMENPKEHIFSDGTICLRVGKRRAGCLLDGKEWNQWPSER